MFEEWFWPLTNQFDHNVQHVLNACFLLDIETGRTSWNDVNRLKTREGASRPHVTALAKELRQKEAKRLGPLAQPRRCNSSRYCMQGMSLCVCLWNIWKDVKLPIALTWFNFISYLQGGNLMFAADCPTKRAAFMTDMTLGRWSHVPAISILTDMARGQA